MCSGAVDVDAVTVIMAMHAGTFVSLGYFFNCHHGNKNGNTVVKICVHGHPKQYHSYENVRQIGPAVFPNTCLQAQNMLKGGQG